MSVVYKIPYERSFASHPKADFWHSTMNDKVKSRTHIERQRKLETNFT